MCGRGEGRLLRRLEKWSDTDTAPGETEITGIPNLALLSPISFTKRYLIVCKELNIIVFQVGGLKKLLSMQIVSQFKTIKK